MLADYHLHTKMCGHAVGEMEEYFAAARRCGLTEIGFADHLPLYFLTPEQAPAGYAMGRDELPAYVDAVKQLQAKDGSIQVRLGIEADYVPGFTAELEKLLKSHPFDYVLGSVHYIDGWSFDNQEEIERYNEWDTMELYKKYFALLQQAALSGFFDVMAHPDLIKKFGFVPEGDLLPLYEDTARVFKQAAVCMEINTAGLRYPIKEIYPAPIFLKFAWEYGIPVTLGSDAHRPDLVGTGLNQAIALLKEVGYQEIALFNKRERMLKKI